MARVLDGEVQVSAAGHKDGPCADTTQRFGQRAITKTAGRVGRLPAVQHAEQVVGVLLQIVMLPVIEQLLKAMETWFTL